MEEKIKNYLIGLCRYYKGGDINPFEIGDNRRGFWTLEWEFVNDYYQKNKRLEEEYEMSFLAHFPHMLKDAPYGAIFEPIKAFLFNRFYYAQSSDLGFTRYLDIYLELSRS